MWIEMLIESVFRDGKALRVRIVNGINKNVTETSETISLDNASYRATGRPVAKARPRLKPAVTLSSISIPLRESILRDFVKIVLWCQKPWSDCCDMINQSQEEVMEQYDSMISWKIQVKVRWCFAMVNYRLDIYSGKKEEEPRQGFNTAWIHTLPAISCASEKTKDNQEVILLILSCKTMYCYQRASLSTSSTSGMQVQWIP